MPADENKALVRRAWEAFAGQEGLDRLAAFYAADYVAHRTDGETSGWAANRRYMEAVFAAFPDLRVTVEDLERVAKPLVHLLGWVPGPVISAPNTEPPTAPRFMPS